MHGNHLGDVRLVFDYHDLAHVLSECGGRDHAAKGVS
jgi:hypothetical protein